MTIQRMDHVGIVVDDLASELVVDVENYEDIYRLCYVRRPEGIVELAERIG